MVFVMRKLDRVPKTLGEKLRALRRGQGVTLDVLERDTRVQRRYLEALERGRYEELPDPIYTRNFLRAYARALNADEGYFVELYEEESGRCDLLDPQRLPRQRVSGRSLFNLPRLAAGGVIAVLFAAIVGYLGFQVVNLLRPPTIVLVYPNDGTATATAMLPVEGKVEGGEVTLSVNGEQVVVNDDHSFRTTIDLSRGLNVVTITAKRRYSQTATVYRRVVFEPETTTATVSFNAR